MARLLAVRGVRSLVGGDHRLVALPDREQLVLAHDVLAALLHVVLVDAREHDRIHRAGLFAETAVDALEQVDVVARGAARAIGADIRVDGDAHRRAHRLAQLAGDAALLAVRITPQRMQAAEARRLRRLLLGVVERELALEEGARGHRHALEELRQEEGLEGIEHAASCCDQWNQGRAQGPTRYTSISISTPIHTSVTGISAFQPRRMIWS